MKILHVAPLNVAGVPYNMMDMQRQSGHDARLVTLHQSSLTFPEDICLKILLPRNPLAQVWRDLKRRSARTQATLSRYNPDTYLPLHGPRNALEHLYFRIDDRLREKRILSAIHQYGLDEYDIIHYDGGLDFFRDSRIALRWKEKGKKIICHYMGSDLRDRGIDPVMDTLSDLNLTNESDHLLRHPDIHYIFIPFDASVIPFRYREHKPVRIVHSPSNRAMKGTHLILPIIEQLRAKRNIEFVLIERTPHDDVLRIKETCDIAIEQVGNFGGTGYGRNSLETLAMGIPTITEMTPDYTAWLKDHPFVLATTQTLMEKLLDLIDNPESRRKKAEEGRAWVEKYHSYAAVNKQLTDLYREHHIT